MSKSRAIATLLSVLSVLLGLGALACSSCRRSDVLATLLEKRGTVERDRAASVGQWSAAEISAEFAVGDGIRSQHDASARLELDDHSKLSLESDTVLRFLDTPSKADGQRLSLEMGEALLETGAHPVQLRTEVGLSRIEPGTHIRLKTTAAGIRYEVSVGLAHLERHDGEKIELTPGQARTVASTPPAPAALNDAGPTATAPPVNSSLPSTPVPALGSAQLRALVRGKGVGAKAPGSSAFEALAPGERQLAAGTTVRLPNGASAVVERGSEQAVLRGAGEFTVGAQDRPFVVTSGGGVSLNDARTEIQVAVPGGTIVARLGASAELRIKKGATDVAVSSGAVDIRASGESQSLRAGERGSLLAKGKLDIAERGLEYVDFAIAAGGSCVVHDPTPPTALGFATEHDCPNGALVELQGRSRVRARGTGMVSLLASTGAHRYEIRCLESDGKPGAVRVTGSVTVLHDAGTSRLPRTAPETLVDTDGRNYTVLYQNLLPKISVRWPNAPKPGPYTLRAAGQAKTETVATAAPFHAFTPGALREGMNRLSFQSASGETSKVTSLNIRYDNAAPAASLTSPQNGQFAPGQTVTVAGTALEGWKVSVGGKVFPLDAQLRFSGSAGAPTKERALAILFLNPRRGAHYYLRRGAR